MTTESFNFEIITSDPNCGARAGVIKTPHGNILTPVFAPVGTLAAVKTLSPEDLHRAKAQIVLGNTYHLLQQPGVEIVSAGGGLAEFMGWHGPTLTDSGGFQVFSLSSTRNLTEEGVEFRSVYDGKLIKLTPESACSIQQKLGADLIVALDECPPFPAAREEVLRAVELTTRWAERFSRAWLSEREQAVPAQAAYLVVQGGIYEDLRRLSIAQLRSIEGSGFCIGGVSVGEPTVDMMRVTEVCCAELPPDKPRHLLGVGTPMDILGAIELGVDTMDCVMPTRNGRNGQVFTSEGILNLRNSKFKADFKPLDEQCSCSACQTFSRAYLHHLVNVGEILGLKMLSLHNIHYYLTLSHEARRSIISGGYMPWKNKIMDQWKIRA